MDQIDEVKQKTDIVSVISGYIELKKAGRNYKALCPFHGEKTPSFMVSPELQIYKCFGCGESGDVFSFLEKYEGMEFGEALKYLADKAGIKLKPLHPGQFGEKERFFEINRVASKFYNYVLLNHPAGKEALKYLTRERGLKIDTVKKFQLGFSPYKEDALAKVLIKRKYQESELINDGLVYRGRGLVDRFSGRVIFSLFDQRGNIVGFQGRILPQDERQDKAKYINSPEPPVYHKSRVLYGMDLAKAEIKKKKEVVVVEGELDMISSWQSEIKNIVAIKGSALTDEQIGLISRFAEKLTLALDSDFAGDIAARRGIAAAFGSGIEVKVASLNGFKDPDEMARKNPAGLIRSLEKAVGIWDFYVNSVFSKYDLKTGEGTRKISKEIVPILSSIPDRIVQAHYIEMVADKLGVPISAVADEVLKTKPSLSAAKAKGDVEMPEERKTRRELLEERLMILTLQTQPKLLFAGNRSKLIRGRLNQRLIAEVEKYLNKNKEFDTSGFSEKLKESEKLQKVKEEFSLLTRKLNELEESEDKGIIL